MSGKWLKNQEKVRKKPGNIEIEYKWQPFLKAETRHLSYFPHRLTLHDVHTFDIFLVRNREILIFR